MVVALKPIYDAVGIKRIVVTTFQAVSGTGKRAIEELRQQVADLVQGREVRREIYPYQIAFNCFPHIGAFLDNGYTEEEMKMVNETRKIFSDPEIAVCATTVRVPVYFGHSESVNIETRTPIAAGSSALSARKGSGGARGRRLLEGALPGTAGSRRSG